MSDQENVDDEVKSEYGQIVHEFQFLNDRAQQLFAGLRDLPPTGKNWQPYFQKTFEVFTKLWKYQQQHRSTLDNPVVYGLKRWEIGEIASKIGRKTSETNYLNEAAVFYEAIRERQYFKDVLDVNNSSLFIKKLRYYARYIVVCLLMNKTEIIDILMKELSELVDEYINVYQPADSAEWKQVISEITTFIEAEKKTFPVDASQEIIHLPTRLETESNKFGLESQKLRIQEAILLGNYANQIKFSELTLDMYRILQALERQPNARDQDKQSAVKRSNPHKYLLYHPNIGNLLNYLSIASKDLNENNGILLYLSADGVKNAKSENGYDSGIATASAKKPAESTPNPNCLYPQDLTPLTRKPLFLVVDSNNSHVFKGLTSVFNKPLVVLASPQEYPTTVKDTSAIGSIFTLFLHSPIKAFLLLQSISQVVNTAAWETVLELNSSMYSEIQDLLEKGQSSFCEFQLTVAEGLCKFLEDDFSRNLIIRYIQTLAILKALDGFNDSKYLPSSNIGSEIDSLSENAQVQEKVQSLLLKSSQLSTSE